MNDQSKSSENRVVPNDEQCALAERLYRAREFYTEDAAQILAERDWRVYGPMVEARDSLREYLNTEITTNSELGDELRAERAAFAGFRDHAWKQLETLSAEISSLKSTRYKYQDDPEMVFDEDLGWVHVIVQQEFKDSQAELAEVRAERNKLLGFYTEIVRELGDDLVVKRFREMKAELATQKVQNNHNWQFQEISEEALKRAEAAERDCRVLIGRLNDAEAKLAGMRAAVIEACKNALYRPLVWYPKGYSIDPNDLCKINERQVNACVAAVRAAFDESASQNNESKET